MTDLIISFIFNCFFHVRGSPRVREGNSFVKTEVQLDCSDVLK